MAPVTRYVFAEMLGISEHFTAGSHEWLPYSDFSTFPKQYDKHQFVGLFAPGRITVNCQLSIPHSLTAPCQNSGQAVRKSPRRDRAVRHRGHRYSDWSRPWGALLSPQRLQAGIRVILSWKIQ